MLLTTHNPARRCPTILGHWTIFGLPTLEANSCECCLPRPRVTKLPQLMRSGENFPGSDQTPGSSF